MTTQRNEIIVTRGETFSIDKLIVNKDGSPYIIGKMNNPYFLITIAQSVYNQEGRYLRNYWLQIPEKLIFYSTYPVRLNSLTYSSLQQTVSLDGLPKDVGYSNYAVYYIVDTDGKNKYYTYDDDTNSFEPYELRLNYTFGTDDTKEWIGQDYVYSIDLVCGDLMSDYIADLYEKTTNSKRLDSKELMYEKLKEINPSLVEGIVYDRELHVITLDIPIVTPTKMSVNSYIQGGITWEK